MQTNIQRQTYIHTDIQTEKLTGTRADRAYIQYNPSRETYRRPESQTYRQRTTQTGIHTDKQRDRQTARHTYIYIQRHAYRQTYTQ